MRTVEADGLADAIEKEFEEYLDLTTRDVKQIVKVVADDVQGKIKDEAPVKTGRYKKSWKATKTSETRLGAEYTVHSKDRYRLTHLLEYGHALRGGGRSRAFPHISKGEQLAVTELKKRIGG